MATPSHFLKKMNHFQIKSEFAIEWKHMSGNAGSIDISHLIREKVFRVIYIYIYIYQLFFNFEDVFYSRESHLGLELKIST